MRRLERKGPSKIFINQLAALLAFLLLGSVLPDTFSGALVLVSVEAAAVPSPL